MLLQFSVSALTLVYRKFWYWNYNRFSSNDVSTIFQKCWTQKDVKGDYVSYIINFNNGKYNLLTSLYKLRPKKFLLSVHRYHARNSFKYLVNNYNRWFVIEHFSFQFLTVLINDYKFTYVIWMYVKINNKIIMTLSY